MPAERTVRHHSYFELLSATARFQAALTGMTNLHTLEILADITPLKFSTTQVQEAVVGSYLALGWFEYDAPTTLTSNVAPVRFGTIRNATDKYSADGEIVLGQRTVLRGIDDGENVTMWQDGVDAGPRDEDDVWTEAELGYPIAAVTDYYVGWDNSLDLYTQIRLHELWIKADGVLLLRWAPEAEDAGALVDRGEFGRNGSITLAGSAATEDTDWRFGSEIHEEAGI